MCNRFRAKETEFRPGRRIRVLRYQSWVVEENTVWTGSARSEEGRWDYWLNRPGAELVEVEADEFREKETWAPVPAGACMAAVVLDLEQGKTSGTEPYRPVKIFTTSASPEEARYFLHDRMPIFGRLKGSRVYERTSEGLVLPPRGGEINGNVQSELSL